MRPRIAYRLITVLALGPLLSMGLSCGPSAPRTPAPPTIRSAGGLEMVLVPAGTFLMGDAHGRENEAPVHEVKLDAFLIDKYEINQQEYAGRDLPNPSHFKGPKLPVEQVTWPQAALYCNARSRAEGLEPCYDEDTAECNFAANGYRLPTEAEWEYACRAGTTTGYSFTGGTSKLGQHAWYQENAGKKTQPVGQKRPNPWGLYDMHGNVSEWCNDMYDAGYYKESPKDSPTGPKEGAQYVLRGGSWASSADALRSAYRTSENSGFSDACLARDAIGFRCVRKAPAAPTAPTGKGE